MRVSIDDTMLSVSVTRVRRSGAFGVVIVVVAIVILFTCCDILQDIAKWFRVSSRALIKASSATIVMREEGLPDDRVGTVSWFKVGSLESRIQARWFADCALG